MSQLATAPSLLARQRKFSLTLFERVVSTILDGENTHPAIEKEGISKRQFYRHVSDSPDLADRFKQAQFERDRVRNVRRVEEAERELHRRAVDGWDEPVFDIKGNLCGHKRRYSDACLIFMLKSLKPDVFGERPTTLVATQVNITPDREKEILREWRQRLGATESAPPGS